MFFTEIIQLRNGGVVGHERILHTYRYRWSRIQAKMACVSEKITLGMRGWGGARHEEHQIRSLEPVIS